MKAQIFTIFPEFFPAYLQGSVLGSALRQKIWQLDMINIRDYANDKHQTVDDTPFGGGAGMVMRADVISSAIENSIKNFKKTKLIYPSPRGKLFTQEYARNLAKEQNIAIICGRYEGIDQRVIDHYDIEEVSIGDYVLSGGELPAMVMLDAVIRNIDGVLGAKDSLNEESFGGKLEEVANNNSENLAKNNYNYLLEYPHYTRPDNWQNLPVPEVLLSGHHKKISEWRLKQAQNLTKEKRPDLYQKYLKNINKF